MCWSAPVSRAFACLDVCFAAYLWFGRRRRNNNKSSNNKTIIKRSTAAPAPAPAPASSPHGMYSLFLLAIAGQEFSQYAVWTWTTVDPEHPQHCSTWTDVLFSWMALGFAQVVPLIIWMAAVRELMAWSSAAAPPPATQTYQNNNNEARGDETAGIMDTYEKTADSIHLHHHHPHHCRRMAVISLALWTTQAVMIVASAFGTGRFCVYQGPHHHQVWICASAVYEAGGFVAYASSLGMYGLSVDAALAAHPTLPKHEWMWIRTIAIANALVAYGWYAWTLEACSIWCWSAFSFGIYFCVKDSIMPPVLAMAPTSAGLQRR